MTNKKYCRPRMTIEARDAINRMCKAQMDEGLFVNERSDAILCIETDISKLHSEIKDKTKKEIEIKNMWFNKWVAESKSHLKTKHALVASIIINAGLIAYMVFS